MHVVKGFSTAVKPRSLTKKH